MRNAVCVLWVCVCELRNIVGAVLVHVCIRRDIVDSMWICVFELRDTIGAV